MANTLLINRTSLGTLSGGEYPTWNSETDPNISNLDYGELAWNNGKQKLYIARVSDNSGGKTLQQIGGTTAFKVSDGSGTTNMAHDSTLTIQGTNNEVTVSESSGTVTVGLANDITIGNDLTVTGDLTVSGDTITANVGTITVEDKTIELGKVDTPTNDTADGSGIFTTAASSAVKSILYGKTNDRWISNIGFQAASFTGGLTGDVTGNVSGSSGSCTGNAATATTAAACTGNAATATNVAYTGLTGTVPTWNQNTTGTAANVTGIVAIANGGTGANSASAARTALDVDQAGTDNSTNATLAGSYDYITAGGTGNQTLTLGQIDLTTDVTGVLPDANVQSSGTWNGKQDALTFGAVADGGADIPTGDHVFDFVSSATIDGGTF